MSDEKGVARATTVTFLDWDDTISPTTWHNCIQSLAGAATDRSEGCGSPYTLEEQEAVILLNVKLGIFLTEAKKLGPVRVLTSASRYWINWSIDHFLPAFSELTPEEILSTRDGMAPEDYVPPDQTMPKYRLMLNEVCRLRPKHVVSVGDGIPEWNAAKKVGRRWPCHLHTFKFSPNPSIGQLIDQVAEMVIALPRAVKAVKAVKADSLASCKNTELFLFESVKSLPQLQPIVKAYIDGRVDFLRPLRASEVLPPDYVTEEDLQVFRLCGELPEFIL